MKSDSIKITFGYIVICLIWGSTWMAIRIGLDSVPPITGAGIRFLLASIFVVILLRFMDIKIQTDSESLKLYLLMSVFAYIFPFSFVYWGEKYVTSGLASILFASFPFFVAMFSRISKLSEKINIFSAIGIVLGFVGILIIFSNDISLRMDMNILGMAAILVSAVMQAWVAVIIKKRGTHLNPLAMNFIPIIVTGIVLTIYGVAFEEISDSIFDLKAILSITFLAMFGTVIAFTTYYWLLKKMNVVILSLSSFITPVIAVTLGWIFLDEQLNERTFLGSLFVLIGILFANFNGIKNYYITRYRKI
jgi:putative membrane protein PagO